MRTNGYDRVRAHASEQANARIDRITDASIARATDNPEYALRRLAEIDREWDIDRALLLGFAGMGGAAFLLASRRNWRWRFPLGAQIAFLSAYAIVGWCPPAMVLRTLGFRTRQEIETERQRLTAVLRAAERSSPHVS
jgi:hypothetical protein